MSTGGVAALTSVVTRIACDIAPASVWEALVFYEQIAERPPLVLRLLLPQPIRTEGRPADVGAGVRCLYREGHLVKRATEIEPGRLYRFDVVEQHLAVGGGVRLAGGSYVLTVLPGGGTEVALETRYRSPRGPRWLWRPIEAAVCHAFHRHLLAAMRRSALVRAAGGS